MATDTTIKSRVLTILGEDNADYLDNLTAPEEVWNEALWEIAGMMPHRYLLTQIKQPVDLENMDLDDGDGNPETTNGYSFKAEDLIVLLVTRTVGDHILDTGGDLVTERYITKPCKEMAFEEIHKATDVNSIYFATNHSPVYTYKNVGGNRTIFVYPEPSPTWTAGTGTYDDETILPYGVSGFTVYGYPRETINETDAGVLGESEWDTMTEFANIPRDIEDIIIKRIALKIVELKLSNMATQEEDTEVFTLLGQDIALLEESLLDSIKKIKSEWESK